VYRAAIRSNASLFSAGKMLCQSELQGHLFTVYRAAIRSNALSLIFAFKFSI